VIVAKLSRRIAANVPTPSRWKEGVEIFLILLSGKLLLCSGRIIFQRSCAVKGSQQLAVFECKRMRLIVNWMASFFFLKKILTHGSIPKGLNLCRDDHDTG